MPLNPKRKACGLAVEPTGMASSTARPHVPFAPEVVMASSAPVSEMNVPSAAHPEWARHDTSLRDAPANALAFAGSGTSSPGCQTPRTWLTTSPSVTSCALMKEPTPTQLPSDEQASCAKLTKGLKFAFGAIATSRAPDQCPRTSVATKPWLRG